MHDPHPAPTPRSRRRRPAAPRRWALWIAAIILVLFVGLNSQQVKVNLIFGTVHLPLSIALLIAACLGALLGWAGARLRRREPG